MNENINQENLNASLHYLDKMGEMSLNQLRETDPEAAKRQEQMVALFKDDDFASKFVNCEEKEEMIRLCAEHGFAMSMEELDALLAQANSIANKLEANDGELNEEDLEQVAGGGRGLFVSIGLGISAVVGAIAAVFVSTSKNKTCRLISEDFANEREALVKDVKNKLGR